jgi:hypothetical protein
LRNFSGGAKWPLIMSGTSAAVSVALAELALAGASVAKACIASKFARPATSNGT